MFKKAFRTGAALCLSVAAVASLSAMASADVIDFEDGSYDPYFTMKTNDGGDLSDLSVVDFNGSKQLKVDVKDCSLLPKLQIHLDKLVGSDNLSDIAKVQLDLTIASKDGSTPPGWIGGALGSESLEPGVLDWSQTDYEGGEYENAVAETILVEQKWLIKSKGPKSGTEGITCLLQRWATDVPYDMYIDNVKLLDKDGNVLATALDAGAAAPAEETPAPAPASDAATDSTPTGNTAAGTFAAVAAVAAAAAVVSRKK